MVFLLSFKKTLAFQGLSRGLFKFDECKDDAWIGGLADRGLSKPVEHFRTENVLLPMTGDDCTLVGILVGHNLVSKVAKWFNTMSTEFSFRADAASLQVAHKRPKSNILRQLPLTPLKNHTWTVAADESNKAYWSWSMQISYIYREASQL